MLYFSTISAVATRTVKKLFNSDTQASINYLTVLSQFCANYYVSTKNNIMNKTHNLNFVVADTLSREGGHLDEDAVKELLDQGAIKELLNHAVCYGIPRAEANDPRVTQEHEKTEGEIIMQA